VQDSAVLRTTSTTRWSFGSGGLARGVVENAHYFVLVYYNQVLGLSPHLGGSGFWRHPYLYAAVLPLALSYYMLWHPLPFLEGDTDLFIYLLVRNSALNLSMTLFVVPAYATVAELTSDYEERARLLSLFHSVMSVTGNGMSVAMYALWLVPTPEHVGGILNVEGYKQAGLVGTLLISASILVFTAGLHRFIPRFKTHTAPALLAPVEFYRQMRDVLRSRFGQHLCSWLAAPGRKPVPQRAA